MSLDDMDQTPMTTVETSAAPPTPSGHGVGGGAAPPQPPAQTARPQSSPTTSAAPSPQSTVQTARSQPSEPPGEGYLPIADHWLWLALLLSFLTLIRLALTVVALKIKHPAMTFAASGEWSNIAAIAAIMIVFAKSMYGLGRFDQAADDRNQEYLTLSIYLLSRCCGGAMALGMLALLFDWSGVILASTTILMAMGVWVLVQQGKRHIRPGGAVFWLAIAFLLALNASFAEWAKAFLETL